MRKLTATLCLTFALLVGITGCAKRSVDLSAVNAEQLRKLKPLAKQGDASAQYNLGVMYDYGQGVSQDYGTALKWPSTFWV